MAKCLDCIHREVCKFAPAVDCKYHRYAEDLAGKTCYKLVADRPTYRNTAARWHHIIDTTRYLRMCVASPEILVIIEERPFCKTDIHKLGHTVFWTRNEAEDFLRKFKGGSQ